jgi:transcription termination/antitermination protein NusG
MAIFIIKVTTNKEERALEMISNRAEKNNLLVYSIVKPHGLKGYIILEAADRESAEEAAFNLPYVKGIIGKTVEYAEIQQMLEPKVEDVNIEVGDIVEMIGQTFKGEKAKVTRIDKQKGEVIVSLLGASVPIPVTVKMDNVKVIRRESDEEDDSEDSIEESRDLGEELSEEFQ